MMEAQFGSPDEAWREDHTEILPHLVQQRICFIDEQGQEREFSHFPLVIGRSHDCGWVIQNKNISRHHAEITFSADAYNIQDLNSLNGVRINGFKIDRVVLEDGDQVGLGELRFTFHIRKAAAARPDFASPAYTSPSPAPAHSPSASTDFNAQTSALQDDFELDDLQIPEVDVRAYQEESHSIPPPAPAKKWWPAIVAILAAASVASAVVVVAYYFLQPQFIDVQQKNTQSGAQTQQQALPAPVQEEPPSALAPTAAETNSAWALGPAATQQPKVNSPVIQENIGQAPAPAEKAPQQNSVPQSAQPPAGAIQSETMAVPGVAKPTVVTLPAVSNKTAAASAASLPLPSLANTHLDLPESVRSTLSQASKVAISKNKAEKKTLSSPVSGTANTELTNTIHLSTRLLGTRLWQFYVAGDETQLASVLEQSAAKVEASGGRQKSLLKLHDTVNHLLDLYHQADKAYQAGDKSQAFTLWAQFLAAEKAWLGNQHSAYYQKVTQSVMNEYLSRAQAAAAAGNTALAAQYRQKAEALAPKQKSIKQGSAKQFMNTPNAPAALEKTAPIPLNQSAASGQSTPSVQAAPAEKSSAKSDAEVLYQKGLRLEYTDLEQAMALWRQVTQTAPTDSEVYAKASAKLAWYDKWRTTTTK